MGVVERFALVAHRRRLRVVPLLVGVTMAAGAAFPGAAAADTDLGAVGFGAIAVDNARSHVFVSTPQADQIDVFSFRGRLLRRITGIYGAWGMTVQGNYLYVAENTAGAIVRINLRRSNQVIQPVATGLNGPRWLAQTGGRLWTTVGLNSWSVVSVNPQTGAQATLPGTYYDPDLATSPGAPHTLFVAEDGLSPGAISRYDVSTTPATQVAVNTRTDQENLEDLAVSPDGTRVIPASGAPYMFEELDASTLQPDGLRYPGQPYPSAVAVSGSGLLATGLNNGYSSPDVMIYRLGAPSAIWSASTNNANGTADVLPHGLALGTQGKWLFVVTARDDSSGHPTDIVFSSFSTSAATAGP